MIGLLKNAGALGVGACCFRKVQRETKKPKGLRGSKKSELEEANRSEHHLFELSRSITAQVRIWFWLKKVR
jgi:hypothetical protein